LAGAISRFFLAGKFRVHKIDLKIRKMLEPVKVRIGDSNITICEFSVLLPLKIEGSLYPIRALVSKNLPFDIILGINFLKIYQRKVKQKFFLVKNW
jgi:hypothetical protein